MKSAFYLPKKPPCSWDIQVCVLHSSSLHWNSKTQIVYIIRSKEGLILKLGQLKRYDRRKIFKENICRKCALGTSSRPLFNLP